MPRSPTIFTNPLIESLPETRQAGLRIKSFHKACVDFHWHFHPEIELIHVKRGNGVRYVGRSIEPFSPGDFCLIGANVPHAFGSSPSERLGAEWMVGHFLPEVWGVTFWRLPEMGRVAGLLERAKRGIRFEARDVRGCLDIFQRLECSPSGASRLAVWLEILECLTRVAGTHYLNPVPFTEVEPDFRLRKALAWVETHADESDMTQAQVAHEVHMSPQAFSRFFQFGTGRTFQRYVSEVRVARICGGLLSGEGSISEIAFQSGFNNLANFNRRFREITGTTPRDYRNANGGISA